MTRIKRMRMLCNDKSPNLSILVLIYRNDLIIKFILLFVVSIMRYFRKKMLSMVVLNYKIDSEVNLQMLFVI